ncbi:DNA repair protein RadC [candidate division BRC1 bacterium HGW-BRC1-1]|jgi:DNA repair protein RadC|nr:MAG: DNA repair protein RadC [candidate division BRC1 bacterium HGW-BRC1-1]
MYRIPVVSLRLVREKSSSYAEKQITDSRATYNLFRSLVEDRDREHLWLICLDTKNRVNCLAEIAIGSLNAAIVHPREVFKTALLANAATVIVLHNHPSGDCAPSHEDRTITKRLVEAGKLLGVPMLDHIIIGNGRFYSFADEGGL